MSCLGYLHDILGSVRNWPRDILRFLFTFISYIPLTPRIGCLLFRQWYHPHHNYRVYRGMLPCLPGGFRLRRVKVCLVDADERHPTPIRVLRHVSGTGFPGTCCRVLAGACDSRRKHLPRTDRVGVQRLSPTRHTKD